MEKEFSEDICGRENYGYVEQVDINCNIAHCEDCTMYQFYLPNMMDIYVTDQGLDLLDISCFINGKSISLEEHMENEIFVKITDGKTIKTYTLQLKEEIDLEKKWSKK